MSEHFRGLPYAPPFNPFRRGSFMDDVNRTVDLKRAEFLFRKEHADDDIGKHAKKHGWRMAMAQNDLELHNRKFLLESSIEHAVVLFLPTRVLLDIQKGYGWVEKFRGNIRAGLQEPWV